MAPIPLGYGKVRHQCGQTVIAGMKSHAACRMGQCTRNVGLTASCGTGDQDGLSRANPVALTQGLYESPIESSRMAKVDVLDARRDAELGFTQQAPQTPVLTACPFLID